MKGEQKEMEVAPCHSISLEEVSDSECNVFVDFIPKAYSRS